MLKEQTTASVPATIQPCFYHGRNRSFLPTCRFCRIASWHSQSIQDDSRCSRTSAAEDQDIIEEFLSNLPAYPRHAHSRGALQRHNTEWFSMHSDDEREETFALQLSPHEEHVVVTDIHSPPLVASTPPEHVVDISPPEVASNIGVDHCTHQTCTKDKELPPVPMLLAFSVLKFNKVWRRHATSLPKKMKSNLPRSQSCQLFPQFQHLFVLHPVNNTFERQTASMYRLILACWLIASCCSIDFMRWSRDIYSTHKRKLLELKVQAARLASCDHFESHMAKHHAIVRFQPALRKFLAVLETSVTAVFSKQLSNVPSGTLPDRLAFGDAESNAGSKSSKS